MVLAECLSVRKRECMMDISKGRALPLGLSDSGEGINFSVEVEQGKCCKLKLYKKNALEPTEVIELSEDIRIKGIRFVHITNLDKEIVEYIYEIDGRDTVDPYALEIAGRSDWGMEEKASERGRIVFPWEDHEDAFSAIEDADVIAYRLHVRGFTKHNSSKVKAKGSFAGLVEKIPYLKELGVNQVQLLPCFDFMEEGMKLNYWGYSSGYYMAPKASYCASEKVVEEFQTFVQAFHANGMEVILDMPFVDAPSLGFQIECMRHYVLQYQIDGFVVNPYITNLEEVNKDPILRYVKLLTQQDDYMIAMRKFLKGDEGMVKEAMWQMRKLSRGQGALSCNYIANHNGFTMMDTISYDGKHNEANGEKNQDGNEYNYCWNCGAEGVTRKKAVVELRKIQMRNAWALLLLSQGTPCILAGDEFGNSQNGNNNAYCQDNEISWLDWRLLKKQKELFEFVKALIALRKSHPVLHQKIALQGMDSKACGIPDISYHGESAWITPEGIASRQLGILYSGTHLSDYDCYVAYNMHWIEHEYALPTMQKDKKWYQILDTATGAIGQEVLLEDQRIVEVAPRSITMYISK